MSVRLTTPLRRPERLAPGMAAAEIAGAGDTTEVMLAGALGLGSGTMGDGGTRTAGVRAGVGGPEEAGEGDSTTHILDSILDYHTLIG